MIESTQFDTGNSEELRMSLRFLVWAVKWMVATCLQGIREKKEVGKAKFERGEWRLPLFKKIFFHLFLLVGG